jgi:hypothetical protein
MPFKTITVRPAAGPETLNADPLANATTTPPIIPAIIPENKGAPDASAIPKHKGKATKKTTIPGSKSARLNFTGEIIKNFLIQENFNHFFFLCLYLKYNRIFCENILKLNAKSRKNVITTKAGQFSK